MMEKRIIGYVEGRPLDSQERIDFAENVELDPIAYTQEMVKVAIRDIEMYGVYNSLGQRVTAKLMMSDLYLRGLWQYCESKGYSHTYMVISYLEILRGDEYKQFVEDVKRYCIPIFEALLSIYPEIEA